ncbi:MAG TPA: hypothetical protein DCX12_04970 [Chloroflexi bacterium]|nr:hypothetical protein [Chloroflexota bacterium]HBV93585.1 hypothetical protein [Chloroflexota bacterium]
MDGTTVYTVACDQSGRVHAFCSWVRMGDDGIALDLIRHRPDAGAGAVDLCIVTAIERARSERCCGCRSGRCPSARAWGTPRTAGRPGGSGPTSTSAGAAATATAASPTSRRSSRPGGRAATSRCRAG